MSYIPTPGSKLRMSNRTPSPWPVARSPRDGTLALTLQSELAARIRKGDYAVGQRLPTEAAIGQEFGVSRTVVREAVSRLQAEGRVVTRHGIGTFVAEPANGAHFRVNAQELATLTDVIDVLELRLAVETEAASLAAQRRKAADLRAMRLALQAFETALASGQPAVEHDLAFHMAIARATGNQRFEGLMTALGEGAIPRARLSTPGTPGATEPGYLAGIHAEHRAILHAIQTQDPAAAAQAMRAHIQQSLARRRAAFPKKPAAAGRRS